MKPFPRRPRGLAALELALGVAAAGVVLALALGALSRLQGLGNEARRVTLAANQAAASQTQVLRCEVLSRPTAAPPACAGCGPISPPMPTSGTVASLPIPSRSCP